MRSCDCVAVAELEEFIGKTIHEVYLAAPGARGWGPDRLRRKQPGIIADGETHILTDVAPGTYELMLVDADGSECEIESVDITSSFRLDLTSGRLRECTASH